MSHGTHECRHTFITLCARYGMNEHIRKKIIGHYDKDMTERIYTHRDIDEMREEIIKIK